MIGERCVELPDGERHAHRRAVVLEWISIVYLLTAIALLAVVLGSSQAMKAAWVEDILSLLPPAVFLIASRYRDRRPTDRFPWGYHRAVSLAYLGASLALVALGALIFLDSAIRLVKAERPDIGTLEIFGEPVWAGWLMLGALAYTGLPNVVLGRLKLPLAAALHDKVLYADAHMNRADWMTAGAAMIGVVGIGFGLWWADAVAAVVISIDIVHDGWRNLRMAGADLMDARPRTHDGAREHPLLGQLRDELCAEPWVVDADVRMREEGHVFAAEIRVVPVDDDDLPERIERTVERLLRLDWKLHDLAIMPVRTLEDRGGADRAPAYAYEGGERRG